ncbi:MAG: hypothetical protein ACI861_001735 [Paracoccaceae bacterium]
MNFAGFWAEFPKRSCIFDILATIETDICIEVKACISEAVVRITEKTGLIYTALFLTVSVAVITQNSDALMAKFRGETNVQAVDDIFTVYAGREQRLFVLSNDVDSQNVQTTAINLLSQPKCGEIIRTGGTFTYSGSASCAGHQSFSYCLNTGLGCEPASVALRIVQARDPVDSVANGPTVELSGFETQIGFNSNELEITNVRLGKIAQSETTNTPVAGAKLAKLAVEAPLDITKPTTIAKLGQVEGIFAMQDLPTLNARSIDTSTLVEVAATTDTLSDVSPLLNVGAKRLPKFPASQSSFSVKANNWVNLAKRAVKTDTGFKVPNVSASIDQSPFGTPCTVSLASATVDGGMVELNLKSPCQPNSRVDVQHGKMRVTFKSDHIGNLNVEIPAFEENAKFSVTLSDGTKLATSTVVQELIYIDRVAVLWKNDFAAELHALEFGALTSSKGDIWQGHPGNLDIAQRYGGGFVTRLGDQTLYQANLVEIYSLPISDNVQSGVIDFHVTVWSGTQNCNENRIMQSLRSRQGRLVGATGLEFRLPDCGNNPQSIVLKNVVRDLIIAER